MPMFYGDVIHMFWKQTSKQTNKQTKFEYTVLLNRGMVELKWSIRIST